MEVDSEFLREAMKVISQMVIELETEDQIRTSKHKRSSKRTNQRNGYRKPKWETRVGEVKLEIPKLRRGSFHLSLLEPHKRPEKALLVGMQEAYINVVSTRKMGRKTSTPPSFILFTP